MVLEEEVRIARHPALASPPTHRVSALAACQGGCGEMAVLPKCAGSGRSHSCLWSKQLLAPVKVQLPTPLASSLAAEGSGVRLVTVPLLVVHRTRGGPRAPASGAGQVGPGSAGGQAEQAQWCWVARVSSNARLPLWTVRFCLVSVAFSAGGGARHTLTDNRAAAAQLGDEAPAS